MRPGIVEPRSEQEAALRRQEGAWFVSQRRDQVTHGVAIEELFGYSTGMGVGGFVYVSGQLARDATGTQIAGSTLEAKFDKVVSNIEAVLRKLGRSLEDVVYVQAHVTDDVADLAELAPLFRKAFGGKGVAGTIVPVIRVNDAGGLLEMSAIATR
jgi:2-iminobutanoate/2-iminopropanoate deaminase